MQYRLIGVIILLTLSCTGLWIIIMAINPPAGPAEISLMQKIESVRNAGWLRYLNYVNAALITILTMALFSGLYFFYRNHQPLWSIIAYSFVPVYGFGNLTSYLSQIVVIPVLADLQVTSPRFAGNAVLGLPSVIFAVIMYRQSARLRKGSVLLALSGLLSIVAAIGQAAQIPALIFMLVISGVVYFLALIFLSRYFMSRQN